MLIYLLLGFYSDEDQNTRVLGAFKTNESAQEFKTICEDYDKTLPIKSFFLEHTEWYKKHKEWEEKHPAGKENQLASAYNILEIELK